MQGSSWKWSVLFEQNNLFEDAKRFICGFLKNKAKLKTWIHTGNTPHCKYLLEYIFLQYCCGHFNEHLSHPMPRSHLSYYLLPSLPQFLRVSVYRLLTHWCLAIFYMISTGHIIWYTCCIDFKSECSTIFISLLITHQETSHLNALVQPHFERNVTYIFYKCEIEKCVFSGCFTISPSMCHPGLRAL